MAGESTKITISGMRELQRRARSLNHKLERRSYSKAVRAASKPVLSRAILMAPGRTGTLKRSIKARSASKPSRYLYGMKLTVIGGKFASDRTAKRRGVGNAYRPDEAVRYYRFQELGTKYHPAQPFLEPALEASASEFLNTLRRELAAEIERHTRTAA
jgi:HK97 gp10 family phage protein